MKKHINEDFEYDQNTVKDAYYDLLKVHGALNDGIFAITELHDYLRDFKSLKAKVNDICATLEKSSKSGGLTLTNTEHRVLKSNVDSVTSAIKKTLDDRTLYKNLKDIEKLLQLRNNIDKFAAKTRML